jgi:catechol 2,3-dioxygenase-like lactoylglutathione lyase family enzyme
MRIQRFDHVTVVVRDIDGAKRFFALLGFEEDKPKTGVITGPRFAKYMGVDDIEADHMTLVVPGTSPRFEVQLLRYRHPVAVTDPDIERLDKTGFNHVCFAVDDAVTMVKHLKANGVEVRGELKDFHDRLLFFLTGPEGVTIELAQWK